MPFQKKVNQTMPIGVVGEFYDDAPRRATVYTVTGDAKNQLIGRVVCATGTEGECSAGAGATALYLGVLCSPKAIPRQTLDTTLAVPIGARADVADKGRLVILTPKVAAVGDEVIYNVNTGVIEPLTPAAPLPSNYAKIANARFFTSAKADALAVIELN